MNNYCLKWKKKTFIWNEPAVKNIIRQTICYMLTHEHLSIESVYDFIKKDYDEWKFMENIIEKYQDYINGQTQSVKTYSAEWGEQADNSDMTNAYEVEIDGMKMLISVTKA